MRILIINPGSTSTKVGISERSELLASKTLHHNPQELQKYPSVIAQEEMRLKEIEEFLEEQRLKPGELAAVVGRGGLLEPVTSGTYVVSDKMLKDLRSAKNGEHASNLGAVLAQRLASRARVPAFVVDPPSVDEFESSARYSGLPEIPRQSVLHALNIRRVALKVSLELSKPLTEHHFIVAHLGGGISVAALRHGKMIDVNNANNGGPFSPERSGGLPAREVLHLCFCGTYDEKGLKRKINGRAGLVGYLGTNDAREIEERINLGDETARKVYMAMAYQVAKEVGAMAAVLPSLDGIIYTGGLAYSEFLIENINSHVGTLAPVFLVPGENELLALAEGATRVLNGQEQALMY
ncbi:MAG: butyrate kinase [Desulfitobacteriaceae bacterium]